MNRSSWLMVAVTVVSMVAPAVDILRPTDPVVAPVGRAIGAVLVAVIAAVNLRHCLAAGRGERPRRWPLTLGILLAAAYLPLPWFRWNWVVVQFIVAASIAMLFHRQRRVAIPVAVTIVVATGLAQSVVRFGLTADSLASGVSATAGLAVGGASLYGAPQLVRIRAELRATALASTEERLRVSRDIHDILGQSLSAVSLKGDLALALLDRDPARARAEIEGVAEVAREALHGLRAIAWDGHPVSLRSEVAGATGLLDAAGMHVEVAVPVHPTGTAAGQLLGWAIREGVTNLLRHSQARTCSLTTSRVGRRIRLEIINDGVADRASDGGSGLAGLGERAGRIGGTVTTERVGDRFRLTVEVPEDAP